MHYTLIQNQESKYLGPFESTKAAIVALAVRLRKAISREVGLCDKYADAESYHLQVFLLRYAELFAVALVAMEQRYKTRHSGGAKFEVIALLILDSANVGIIGSTRLMGCNKSGQRL
jgi:hypothetical protein